MYFLLLFTFHLNAFRNDIHYSWLMCYFHPQLTQILVQIWKIYLVRPCPQAIPSCRMRCRQDPWRIGNAGYVRFHVRVIAWRQHRFLNRHKTQQQRSPQSQWSHLKWKKKAKKKKKFLINQNLLAKYSTPIRNLRLAYWHQFQKHHKRACQLVLFGEEYFIPVFIFQCM